jgi:hypothetical protein
MRYRTLDGRYAPRDCGDPHCSGKLVASIRYEKDVLECDGLTLPHIEGSLESCIFYVEVLPSINPPE